MARLPAPLALVVLPALVLGACGETARTDGDGRLSVVASFYPLAEAASQVGGERVEVTNLTPAGTEPHDLELTSTQVDELEDASLVVVMGRGFQPAVEEVAERRSGATLEVLRALPVPQEGEVAEEEEGGRPGAFDPHVWLDPILMQDVVDGVADALSVADPGREGAYRANAESFVVELRQLDQRYRQVLEGCAQDVLVVAHEAFGWMADRYGLRQEAIAGIEPDQEPDPQRLAELTDLVRRQGVTTIFTETLVDPDVAETLAREGGVGTAVLDPLEGLGDDAAAEGASYVSVMDGNLAALQAALDCG